MARLTLWLLFFGALLAVACHGGTSDPAVLDCRNTPCPGETDNGPGQNDNGSTEPDHGSWDNNQQPECLEDWHCDNGYECVNKRCVPEQCTPSCANRECGSNGCGGSCGTCNSDDVCVSGVCRDITCNATNPCPEPLVCFNGFCQEPCSSDYDCPNNYDCVQGQCVPICVPSCYNKECGSNGCGGSCGSCGADNICVQGICKDIQCGPTNPCPEPLVCTNNICQEPCYSDGDCPNNYDCVQGQCVPICVPSCYNKECGSNGCGGSCGSCGSNETCNAGQCIPNVTPTHPLFIYGDVAITVQRDTSAGWVSMGAFAAREAVEIEQTMADNNGLVLVFICAVGGPYAQVFYFEPGLRMDGEPYVGTTPPTGWNAACTEQKTATVKLKQGTCVPLTLGCP